MTAPQTPQRQLALATEAARDAYRQTTRLIRLLEVLGQPLPPEELLDKTLTVLSEVFFAEVAVVAHRHGSRLVAAGACGLQETDPAFAAGWPVSNEAATALRTTKPVAASGELDPESIPSSLFGLSLHSAAWIPLSPSPGTIGTGSDDLLVLFRCAEAQFGGSDLQVLSSVAARLRLAVDERERSGVIEQLARFGHRLARHLELEPLLDEAVELLQQVTEADRAWVVTIEGELAYLRAHRGLPPAELTGWPRRISSHDRRARVTRPRSLPTEEPGAAAAGGAVLQVPVVRDGELVGLLYAARGGARPFLRDAPETMAIFANYLAVAIVNADLYRTLRNRATHDQLTGLANRTLVVQQLEALLDHQGPASDPGRRVGLLFCDLDRFKAVNDLLGHKAGDELLQEVASRLRSGIRPQDLLARFGGDEFVVVLDPVRDLAEVAEVGQRLTRELDRDLTIRGQRIRPSASIGGVLGTPGRSSAVTLLRDADAAMYAAKERGPGRVEIFDEVDSGRAVGQLDLRAELSLALERDQLQVLYQPIVDLWTGRIEALEAVLQWRHPRHGLVPPEVFLPLAEDTGAIARIGGWAMEQACRQLAAWRRQPGGRGVALAVDVPPGQFRREHLVPQMLGLIRATGAEPDQLWLEVTEDRYLNHPDVSTAAHALRDAGVHFTLDHFGAANSSLSSLRWFPIENIKIDGSFLAGIAEPGTDRDFVRAILAVADSLNLATVAQDIRSGAQLTAVRDLGCRLGQGSALAEPLPALDVRRLLASPVLVTGVDSGQAPVG